MSKQQEIYKDLDKNIMKHRSRRLVTFHDVKGVKYAIISEGSNKHIIFNSKELLILAQESDQY